ncbi:calcium-responsive transcription factor-like [Saccostrea cucullata]|uniref:calcium-responsive transcription factor-like n=1 Tax=Saccostrea cuccullata TaxID=36930 RepID=UPI002ED2F08A
MVKECHHGPDRQRRAKEKKKQRCKPGDHDYSNKGKARKKIQMSKKQACPATIRIRAIMKFPDFKVDSYNNKLMKRKISRNLKQAFANRDTIQKSLVYLVSYPSVKDHKNHLTGEFAGFTQRIDPRLVTRIKELVADGVRNVSEMKRHLLISVKNDLCPDEDIPRTNRRFFPLDKDIKNHMDIAINSLRFSKDDQLNLESLVETWQESNPEDNFFLRTSYDTTTHGDIPSEDFLFVHQTTWQKRLLNLYGRDICIMDATYKTSKYALPLFFICVQTNVGHSICGSFVVVTETKKSIQEGLKKIKEWNPGWNPSYFMTDYDEREIQAVEEVFEDCTVYLCSFHREQSWTRWLKQIKHGIGSNQDEVIEL